MKKLIICLLLCAALVPSVFARSSDYDDDYDKPGKFMGLTPGVRLSIVGLEPTLALNFLNLEVEAACALNSGWDGKNFGYAPSLSVGYNANPYNRGAFAVFGVEYMYLSPAYMTMMTNFLNLSNILSLPSIHSASIFYKGGVNFNSAFGMLWRIRLPLWIMDSQGGNVCNINVTNVPGFATNFLIGICTFSVGLKLTI